jgi:hypothetical protein
MSELVLGEREGREDGEREGCRELLFFGRGNVGGVPINSRAVLRSGILFGIRFFLGPNIKIRYSVLAKPNTEYNHS